MPMLTDNIIAGPAGHTTAGPAGCFTAGGPGETTPGPAGFVVIYPATQGVRTVDATMGFEVLDATQGSLPEITAGAVIDYTA
jgi:hypothetical protein